MLSVRVKACLFLPLFSCSHAPCTSRCISGCSTDSFPAAASDQCAIWPWRTSRSLPFLVLLTVRSLMFSDTSSCNTGADLSPLTVAPTASSTKPLLHLLLPHSIFHRLWAVIEIFSTHSSSQACTVFLLPGWKYIGLAVWVGAAYCGGASNQIRLLSIFFSSLSAE